MTDRLAQFQAKHPDRAQRWDRLLGPLLGMGLRVEGKLARAALDDVESRLLAAVYGEEDPVVATSTATVP